MGFLELLALIKSDIDLKKKWFLKNDSWFGKNVRVYVEPGTLAVIIYRYGHWLQQLPALLKWPLMLPYLVAWFLVVICFGIYINVHMKAGKGFAIHNFSGIFLPNTTVGDNFIVFQNVTVGHLRGQGGKPPKIGNNVFLGAGAKVMGDISIGNNVVVGANSLVINNVPDGCSVIGVPARIVSRDTGWIQEKLDGKGDHW
jgi:serine O-acetyltransferase